MVVDSTLSFNALRVSGLWIGLLLLLCACASEPPSASCGVTGRERSCPCSGNAVGIQACQFDGQWESCKCYPRAGNAGSVGVAAISGSGGSSANASAGRGGSTGQRSSADRAQAGGPANPWNPWDGFPGFAGFPWSR